MGRMITESKGMICLKYLNLGLVENRLLINSSCEKCKIINFGKINLCLIWLWDSVCG